MAPKKKQTKKVKGWLVLDILGEPQIAYRDKEAAKFACTLPENKITACTITYQI